MTIAGDITDVPVPEVAPTETPARRKVSLGGGNDGRGAPMFSKLETSKSKHMFDGYEDMKPADGLIGGTYRKLVNVKHGAGIAVPR